MGRSALATGPRLAAWPTSQPVPAPEATDESQKKFCGYWIWTVLPSTQAGVVARETGLTVDPLAAAMPDSPRLETTMLVVAIARAIVRRWPRMDVKRIGA